MKISVSIWYKIIFKSLSILLNSRTQNEMIPAADFHFGKLKFPHVVHEVEEGSDKSFCPVGLNPEDLNNGSDIHEPKYDFKSPNNHWLQSSEVIYLGKQINKLSETTQKFCLPVLVLTFPPTWYSASYAFCGEWGHLTRMDIMIL